MVIERYTGFFFTLLSDISCPSKPSHFIWASRASFWYFPICCCNMHTHIHVHIFDVLSFRQISYLSGLLTFFKLWINFSNFFNFSFSNNQVLFLYLFIHIHVVRCKYSQILLFTFWLISWHNWSCSSWSTLSFAFKNRIIASIII